MRAKCISRVENLQSLAEHIAPNFKYNIYHWPSIKHNYSRPKDFMLLCICSNKQVFVACSVIDYRWRQNLTRTENSDVFLSYWKSFLPSLLILQQANMVNLIIIYSFAWINTSLLTSSDKNAENLMNELFLNGVPFVKTERLWDGQFILFMQRGLHWKTMQ